MTVAELWRSLAAGRGRQRARRRAQRQRNREQQLAPRYAALVWALMIPLRLVVARFERDGD
jgi:hypothetical protein